MWTTNIDVIAKERIRLVSAGYNFCRFCFLVKLYLSTGGIYWRALSNEVQPSYWDWRRNTHRTKYRKIPCRYHTRPEASLTMACSCGAQDDPYLSHSLHDWTCMDFLQNILDRTNVEINAKKHASKQTKKTPNRCIFINFFCLFVCRLLLHWFWQNWREM